MNRRARKCEMQSTVEIASGVKLLGSRESMEKRVAVPQRINPRNEGVL